MGHPCSHHCHQRSICSIPRGTAKTQQEVTWCEGGGHMQPKDRVSFQQGAGRLAILHGENKKNPKHILRREEPNASMLAFSQKGDRAGPLQSAFTPLNAAAPFAEVPCGRFWGQQSFPAFLLVLMRSQDTRSTNGISGPLGCLQTAALHVP